MSEQPSNPPTETPVVAETPVVTTPAEAPAETPPAEIPPAPTLAQTEESLAEKTWREAHTVPESNNPADVVPNRPNIRPPAQPVPEEPAAEPTPGEVSIPLQEVAPNEPAPPSPTEPTNP